jgi:hypothetical protein
LPRERRPIELSLRTTDGQIVELADQRGSPVLLFLFATYDGASLATVRHVARFAREARDTVVLAVALQPNAETFATAFAETQTPPYTVVWDPRNAILRGVTDLGIVEAIPTLIMIDAHGFECARHVGYANDRALWSMHAVAVSRGGIAPPGSTGDRPPAQGPPDPDRTESAAPREDTSDRRKSAQRLPHARNAGTSCSRALEAFGHPGNRSIT